MGAESVRCWPVSTVVMRLRLVISAVRADMERRRIAALAIEAHLPTLFALREHVQEGGLLSHCPESRLRWHWKRSVALPRLGRMASKTT
jgi:hypothetical protein